ncbi:hypothetical protein EGW08_018696 [Elysia chlorotica]|uniref:G-protein coupled receptors family 1 profile domain-containing protein n=1 Tax=Elysia chlorotica TaxID=188477 RepID=A0A3S1H724_ELYCH|nr:hypothetical protein EGW08_018696 [Elysia chlorotica]
MDSNLSSEANSTAPGIPGVERGSQTMESVFVIVQPVISWMLIGTGIVGIPANILIVIVFCKMGVSSPFQISCTGLAISDLLCVVASVMCGATALGVFRHVVSEREDQDLNNIVAGLPQIVFSRITALLTAWISLERFLSVVYPMKVKFIITRRVTTVVISAIFGCGCSLLFVVSVGYMNGFHGDQDSNGTTLNLELNEGLSLHGFRQFIRVSFGLVLPVLAWGTVVFCTLFLIVRLRQSTKWKRAKTPIQAGISSPSGGPNAGRHTEECKESTQLPPKERRIINIVVVIACVFLVSTLPMSAHLVAGVTLPEYSENGRIRHLVVMNGLACVFISELNSCVNIIIYAVSGNQFRSVLLRMFGFSPR